MEMGILDYIMSTALLLILLQAHTAFSSKLNTNKENGKNAEMSEKEKTTSKICPNCGNTHLILLYSMKLKLCTDCRTEIRWYLEEGQKPLLGG